MSEEALRTAEFEARNEAAPFAVAAAGMLVALALVSRSGNWELIGDIDWWIWIVAAVPQVALSVTLLAGLKRVTAHDTRRAIVKFLLGFVLVGQVAIVVLLVASLLNSSRLGITGSQLLLSAVTVWLTNTIAFGLVFWELDCGGPVRRALTPRQAPDFQFPQDENPHLARDGWSPGLVDYVYLSLTNSIAFSPTDVMPLTRPAKLMMAAESVISVVAIVVVAARAINVLTG